MKAQLPDKDIWEFLTAVEQLHPTLQQNLVSIQEIVGLQQLAESVSMGKIIAVSDASLGSQKQGSTCLYPGISL